MATNFLWGTGVAGITLLGAELNSLTDGSGTAYGTEFGGANDYQLGILWLHLASNSLAFTAGSHIDVFFVSSTTPNAASGAYPTYTSGAYKLAESNYLVASIAINPATQSANVVNETYVDVRIPMGFKQPIIVNHTGVTLPSSGNTLTLYPTPTQY